MGQLIRGAKLSRDINAVRYTDPNTPKQSTETSISNMNPASPLANAMVGMAIAKNNPGTFGPIKLNTSNNKTGRVIS
jgi:hypothetical protein